MGSAGWSGVGCSMDARMDVTDGRASAQHMSRLIGVQSALSKKLAMRWMIALICVTIGPNARSTHTTGPPISGIIDPSSAVMSAIGSDHNHGTMSSPTVPHEGSNTKPVSTNSTRSQIGQIQSWSRSEGTQRPRRAGCSDCILYAIVAPAHCKKGQPDKLQGCQFSPYWCRLSATLCHWSRNCQARSRVPYGGYPGGRWGASTTLLRARISWTQLL